jgi:hypothetical protein
VPGVDADLVPLDAVGEGLGLGEHRTPECRDAWAQIVYVRDPDFLIGQEHESRSSASCERLGVLPWTLPLSPDKSCHVVG